MKKECPVVKNEIYELNISGIGSNGEGIGRIDGYTLFVRGTIPGD
jgi:23S rRNA (uracil1939-C5)-methyltransferase